MTKQVIGIGAVANDGTGDALRTAFDKANQNFTELYANWEMTLAASDETTALTTGTKLTFRMPRAITLTGLRGSLVTAQASGSIFTVDVKKNGTSVLSTLLTIDNTEKTSVTAATAAVISTSALANDDEISISITQIGDGTAKGLKLTLYGTRA